MRNTVSGSSGGVLEYLIHKDESTLLELYQDATRGKYVCRAILQQLSPSTQQVVLRLCCCGGTFPVAGIMVWIQNSVQEFNHILKELQQWSISENKKQQQDGKVLALNASFHKGLQSSLEELDSSPWTPLTQQQLQAAVDGVASNESSAEAIMKKRAQLTKMLPSLDELDQYNQRQWNTVLHFLVGTSQQEDPPPHVVHFLLQTGLMQPDPESNSADTLVITRKGYDFMLQPQQDQVWHFVQEYLKTSLEGHKKAKELKKEALLFLISLSFGRVGDAYDGKCLNKNAWTLMMDLSLFGLLYVAKLDKSNVFFYPTRVAVQLLKTTDDKSGNSSRPSNKVLEANLSAPVPDPNNLAIIVQTNFQVCAYTTSELHVSMLGLFCNVDTIRRMPNVVFMSLTRDSVKAAFSFGITANQILAFLEKHAHYKLLLNSNGANTSPLPQNVVDQIWLWDRERHRCRWTKVRVHSCLVPGEFKAVKEYAVQHGAHAWSSAAKNEVLLKEQHAERVLNFVRAWRAKSTQQG